jgi:outer membrane protein OmpA-like peptidoglycan-associated protein
MDNLITAILDEVGGSNLVRLAGLLGVAGDKAPAAMQSGIATVLAGLAGNAAKPGGAASLLSMLGDKAYDGSVFGTLGSVLGSTDSTSALLRGGEALLPSIFGSDANRVIDTVGSYLGLKSGMGKTLLSVAAPLVLGQLGKLVRTRGLSASGLLDLLMGQRGFLAGLLPTGLGPVLGFADEPVRRAAATVQEPTSSGLKKWLPWIGLLLLALLLYSFCLRSRPAMEETARQVGQATIETGKQAADAVIRMAQVVLPNGERVDLISGSFNQAFAEWLASNPTDLSRRFHFDVVEFDTGSAALTARSRDEVGRFARVLGAYPAVRVRLIGHTDATGNDADNLRLSVERAERVKGALVAAGIAADRIEVEGRGATEPKAPNDTDAGRAQNRRVELMVTAL